MTSVSIYKDSLDTKGVCVSFDQIMHHIKEGRWRSQIVAVRRANLDDRKELKKQIPAFTGSGLFTTRSTGGLVRHSGRIIIDFDKLTGKLELMRGVLTKDPYTEYLFESCSGDGLAVIVKIPPDAARHLQAFLTLEKYYSDLYGFKIDAACKDVTRLRFVSYDPNLYHNPESITLQPQDTNDEEDVSRGELFVDGRRDNDLYTLANVLARGGARHALAVDVLERVIQSWGESKQDPNKWAVEKWVNACKYGDRKTDNLTAKINEWVKANVRPGCTFKRSELYSEFSCVGENLKLAVRGVLAGLCEQGIIELTGKANGVYRLKDNNLVRMDIKNTTANFFEMKWPLGIENLARMLPKNIAIIAGAKSSGKSAMMLNVALMNKDVHRVRYISSEMAENELRFRLDHFKTPEGLPLPISAWDNVEFYYKSSGFADMVIPDGLNIVDFMEIHDNFWRIGAMISEVFDKLTSGVAVIGVQKARGKKFGRGAEFTQEKARIYITLDRQQIGGRAKLVEVKTPVNMAENPRGSVCDYKLYGGCNFHIINGWHDHYEEESEGSGN